MNDIEPGLFLAVDDASKTEVPDTSESGFKTAFDKKNKAKKEMTK